MLIRPEHIYTTLTVISRARKSLYEYEYLTSLTRCCCIAGQLLIRDWYPLYSSVKRSISGSDARGIESNSMINQLRGTCKLWLVIVFRQDITGLQIIKHNVRIMWKLAFTQTRSSLGLSECRSGKIDCSKLTSAPVTSEVVGFESRSNPLPRRLWFPPTLHYKSPNIVFWANNVLVDAQLSIQYLKRSYEIDSKVNCRTWYLDFFVHYTVILQMSHRKLKNHTYIHQK
jgi:hypothetical protein